MSLAGLINENRIEKLYFEKYPQNIIDFATNFAKETTKNTSLDNVNKNQYIPWIASQAKINPIIMNDKDKLSVIISWIKNSGYNKINSTEPFEKIYEKAKKWLKSKNINLSTGERVDGGKVVKKYPNGFQWIQATEVNWCINAGEQNGWCFNQLNRAEQFVGMGDVGANNKGYFLLDDKHNPIIALQYSSIANWIDDIQGAFNTPLNAKLLPYAFDLFRMLPLIKDIKGHQESFWKSFDFVGGKKFKHELLAIPNISFEINKKLEYKLPLSKEEFDSLPVYKKLRFSLPLTKEEINSLDIDDKIQFHYATEEELKNLPVHKKVQYDIPFTAFDYKKINQPILKRVWQVLKKKLNPMDLFIERDFDGFTDFVIDEDGIKIEMKEEEYDEKYSGLDENNKYLQYYDGSNEEADSDELEYMNNYLNEENLEKIKNLAILIGVSDKYDFTESNQIYEFLDKYVENAQEIFDEYLIEMGYAKGRAKEESITETLKKEQKFKFVNNYLILPWKELYEFLKNHPIIKFKDLENLEINGEISLDEALYHNEISNESIKELNLSVGQKLKKSLEIIESSPGYSESVDEFQYIIKNLKFEKGEFEIYITSIHRGSASYKLELSNKTIFIQNVNYAERKISVFIIEYTDEKKKKHKKMLKGNIPFENLANYVQQYALFESKIRRAIKKILSEGGNFRYSDTNDNITSTFIPSREVVETAKKAIQAVQNNKLVQSDASNEGSGIQKANSLSNAEPMTHAQLKRMEAFFTNNEASVKQELGVGKNINNSPLIQKWNLWGGDAGKNWVRQQIGSQESSNKTSKKIRNPEDGVDTKNLMNPLNTRINR